MAETYAAFATKHLDVRTRSGAEWMCLCPYHEDSNPSFAINVRKGLFVCYACGVKGRVDALAQHLKVSVSSEQVVSTVDDVKKKIGSLLQQEPERRVPDETVSFFEAQPSRNELWARRKIMGSVLDRFRLGYDPMADALTIPVHHPAKDRVVSLIRRRLNPEAGQPKYHYERGFKISENLYGSWQARQVSTRLDYIAVTEGSIDTLSMWQVQIPSVALLGARVSEAQARLLVQLDPLGLVVMTDNDEAGRGAAQEIEEKMRGTGIMVLRPTWWPSNRKDPGEMSEQERLDVFHQATLVKAST